MKSLDTERLILRGWKLDDVNDLHEYAKDPNVGSIAGWAPHTSLENSMAVLKSYIENDNAWAIELKENRKVIGMIKIYPDDNHGRYHAMMINYALSTAYWGHGYMTETVSRVIQYAFEELNIDLLTVFHYPQNVASRRVIEKCGFEYDGTIEQGCTRYDGQVFDAVCHSLLREDWLKQKTQQRSGLMNLTIKPLTPELSDDYFDFFENRAFTDDSPYRCYCQVYQMSSEQQRDEIANATGADPGTISKHVAQKQINSGVLRGYLAYADGVSIGWCNANDKSNYSADHGAHFYSPVEKREMAVVCFEIAPEYRGKGVATALLNRVLSDAKNSGYVAIEAFPIIRNERYEWDCAGPYRLYEKAEFVKVAEHDGFAIVRKDFKP